MLVCNALHPWAYKTQYGIAESFLFLGYHVSGHTYCILLTCLVFCHVSKSLFILLLVLLHYDSLFLFLL